MFGYDIGVCYWFVKNGSYTNLIVIARSDSDVAIPSCSYIQHGIFYLSTHIFNQNILLIAKLIPAVPFLLTFALL